MLDITITIDPDYTLPEGDLTDAQYLAFVLNMAAQSYARQYQAPGGPPLTPEQGIAAARAAFNEERSGGEGPPD